MVSANHWLRGIKTYRLSWYLTWVSANHASSNWAQGNTKFNTDQKNPKVVWNIKKKKFIHAHALSHVALSLV